MVASFAPNVQIECLAIFSKRRVLPDLEADMLESLKAAGAIWERNFRERLKD